MACKAYIRVEKSRSRDFPYRLYMACTAYIRYEKVAPETSPTGCTWPVHPVYMVK
jgi:hypothetical protein